MAIQMSSPGVYVTEIDSSEIVPSVSSSVTVFGGNFSKGPTGVHTQITSVDDLVEFYGKPTNENYNDWYQCYNFLQYGNNLLISRAVNINGCPTNLKTTFVKSTSLGYGTQAYGESEFGEGEITKEAIIVTKTNRIHAGDIIGFSDNAINAIDESKTDKYYVTKTEDYQETGIDYTAVYIDRKLTLPPQAQETESISTWFSGKNCYLIAIHHNGSAEALEKGNSTNCVVTWKVDSKKYQDYEDGVLTTKRYTTAYNIPFSVPSHLDGSPSVQQSSKILDDETRTEVNSLIKLNPEILDGAILFGTNKKILNANDWDYKKNSVAFGTTKSKLKFISKTPGVSDSLYTISIAVPSDFASNDKQHTGNHCIKFANEGLSVDSYFEYAPQDNSAQIAVFIFDNVAKEMKETYLCSLDPDEVDSFNNSLFIENIINRRSNCVYVKCNTSTPATKEVDVETYDDTGDIIGSQRKVVPNIESYTLVADVDGKYHGKLINFVCASDSLVQEDDLLDAYEIFDNKDLIDIDIIIANELDNGLSAKKLAEKREDCIAFIGIPYEYNGTILAVSKRTADATANIVNYRNSINYNTMWCSLVANYKYQYDRYNDTYRWVNVAGDVAGLRAQSTENYASWWASAGLNRGQIKNVQKLAFSPNREQIGTLYNSGINSIVNFPGQGTVLWGQKTMLDKSSSFDRVNVRGLFNTIERALAKMSKYQVFEFNDVFTRNKVVSIMNPYLETVKSDRGIQDFMVVCNETNNTPDIVSRNQMVVDIYIKPTYVAEFINLRFTNLGVNNFSTAVSN